MARRSPNGRPLVGQRLNDTAAIVSRGICPPQGCYELHYPPSAECMVTPIEQGGMKCPTDGPTVAPDRGRPLARSVDYLRTIR